MPQYFFILGRLPQLSRAEFQSKLKQLNLNFEIQAESASFLIGQIEPALNLPALQAQLAGIIKSGLVKTQADRLRLDDLLALIPRSQTKINFGLSAYEASLNIKEWGLKLKKELTRLGQSARLVPGTGKTLSSVTVAKNHLLTKGAEIVILKTPNNQYYLGQTQTVQDFENFSRLDYGRPARDAKRGMLPPKLAQMMINLAEAEIAEPILDPFCGIGTVLQQALLLGYTKVIGSDKDSKVIDATKKNLQWLSDSLPAEVSSPITSANYRLFCADVKSLGQRLKARSLGAIVTEPDLGPPLRGTEPFAKIDQIVKRLTPLYQNLLEQSAKLLKKGGYAIIIFPSFPQTGQALNPQRFLPKNLKILNRWTYSRPEQKVLRQIYKFESVA